MLLDLFGLSLSDLAESHRLPFPIAVDELNCFAAVDFAVVAPVAVVAVVAAIDRARSVESDRCNRSPWRIHKTIQPA